MRRECLPDLRHLAPASSFHFTLKLSLNPWCVGFGFWGQVSGFLGSAFGNFGTPHLLGVSATLLSSSLLLSSLELSDTKVYEP